MAVHQAPPSLGFSRQKHWSGLPLPSPMHESEKWKWIHSVVSDPQPTPRTAAYQATPSMGFSRQKYWSRVPLPSPLIQQPVYKRFLQFILASLIPFLNRQGHRSMLPYAISCVCIAEVITSTFCGHHCSTQASSLKWSNPSGAKKMCLLSRSVVSNSLWPHGL